MRLTLLAGAACALLLCACGGGDQPATAVAPVRLQVTSPGDQDAVRSEGVEIRGTVTPSSATVTVRGQRADVAGGSWAAQVSLEPGVNVVDVLASAGRARPALTAVRVRRIVDVEVPEVTGLSADDARQELEDADLKAELQTEDGGFFDELLGGKPEVCQTSPTAGARVDPGSTVIVQLARRC
jgi:PASTA domain/Glucodextranase, domain B